jgi:uncharacterized protein (TIGR03382 family)
MKKLAGVVAWVLSASGVAPSAGAATVFQAVISHTQEVPAIPDEGSSGVGTFVLNDEQTALSYDIQLFGLDLDGNQTPGDPNDNVTRTHFHAAAAGANGGIVFGQIDGNAALRNDLDDLVVDAVAGRITGVWDGTEGNATTLAEQLSNLLNAGLYFNVHTSDHGGGEIRGQLVLVPEPASASLCLLGVASLAWLSRARRPRSERAPRQDAC